MQKPTSTFYPQLDSLRAIAVLLVIVSHWFGGHILNRYTSNGTLGVTLFFVLSGFLITGILLDNKDKIESGLSIKRAFAIFYIRRSLRIFPIYYFLLFVLLVFNIAAIRESFWWHFFYGSNFLFWIKGAFDGALSHLWSLAVEEQFYLCWPAIIFFIPKRYIPYSLVGGIIIAVAFRFFITLYGNDLGRILMPGSLDSFCIGGLLVWGKKKQADVYIKYVSSRKWFVLFAFLLLVIVHSFFFKQLPEELYTALFYLFISIAFGVLIDRVADTVRTPVIGFILSNRVLLYIGKISYGVYLYHNFLPPIYGLPIPAPLQAWSYYIEKGIRFCILILIASVSWYLIEKPVLKLKSRFEMK